MSVASGIPFWIMACLWGGVVSLVLGFLAILILLAGA